MTSFTPAPRANFWVACGCSKAEIAPCREFGTVPVAPGCPPGNPNVRMMVGVAVGFFQSMTSIACDCRHTGAVLLLPGAKVRPVLHSHHCLWVERRLRIDDANTGALTLVTSHTS